MTPGLARGPPFPSKATKGAVVAIASLEKPSVPMVVGVCEIDVSTLQEVQGAKGHAVRGEHWDGDEIWAWSTSGKSGASAPDEIIGWDTDNARAELSEGVGQLAVDDHEEDADEGGVPLEHKVEDTQKVEPHNEHVEGEDPQSYAKPDETEKELTTKGMARIHISSSIMHSVKILNAYRNRRCFP